MRGHRASCPKRQFSPHTAGGHSAGPNVQRRKLRSGNRISRATCARLAWMQPSTARPVFIPGGCLFCKIPFINIHARSPCKRFQKTVCAAHSCRGYGGLISAPDRASCTPSAPAPRRGGWFVLNLLTVEAARLAVCSARAGRVRKELHAGATSACSARTRTRGKHTRACQIVSAIAVMLMTLCAAQATSLCVVPMRAWCPATSRLLLQERVK